MLREKLRALKKKKKKCTLRVSPQDCNERTYNDRPRACLQFSADADGMAASSIEFRKQYRVSRT